MQNARIQNHCLSLALSLAAVLVVLASLSGAAAPRDPFPDETFEFALIGDMPYDDAQETNFFPNLIADINRARMAFVVHNGDFKSSATPCTDDLFARRHQQFQTFRHPFIFLFGDNEWSDCGRAALQPMDPLERLEKLRAVFTQGDRSLGRRTLPLMRQSETAGFATWRENVRWVQGRVVFAGLNAPGSDNHFGTPEYGPRNAANIAWIREAFALARQHDLRAVMIVMQANPHFEIGSTNRARLGFNEMLRVLEDETIAFAKPVVLVHGDTHYFRIDQPLVGSRSRRRLENFTRVETFGNPDLHWLRVTVDRRDPNVFNFRPQYVKENLIRHAVP